MFQLIINNQRVKLWHVGVHSTRHYLVQRFSLPQIYLLIRWMATIVSSPLDLLPVSLPWRHNGPDSVSNHQPHDCLLNRLFRRRWKKTSKLRVTGLCVGNSPGPVNSPHKGPVTRKMLPFDDVIMVLSSCYFVFCVRCRISPNIISEKKVNDKISEIAGDMSAISLPNKIHSDRFHCRIVEFAWHVIITCNLIWVVSKMRNFQ